MGRHTLQNQAVSPVCYLISSGAHSAATPLESPPEDALAGPQTGWRDEVWGLLVGTVDNMLRFRNSIEEFTDDPRCVLRLGRGEAHRTLVLRGGVSVRVGQAVGTIHFWNEHLPAFDRTGPNIRWAAEMRRRVVISLRELADFVRATPSWNEIQVFRAETALFSRLGMRQLRRVGERYGFELVPETPSWGRQLHDIADCLHGWGLTRVHNPQALHRQPFFRRHYFLWITRAALIDRYGGVSSAEPWPAPAAIRADGDGLYPTAGHPAPPSVQAARSFGKPGVWSNGQDSRRNKAI